MFEKKKTVTIYDKLNSLNEEIISLIRIESELSQKDLDQELAALREEAFRERSPEAEFTTRLFRKFSSLRKPTREKSEEFRSGMIGFEVPSYFVEGTGEQIAGHDAYSKNIFWYRALTVLFTFICWMVLANTDFINQVKLHPQETFVVDISYCRANHYLSGYFDMRPYQASLGISLLVFLHSLLFAVYYLLPVDEGGSKYVPGMAGISSRFLNPETYSSSADSCCNFWRNRSKFIEMVVDAVLFICALIIAITASSYLERGEKFQTQFSGSVYYTLVTYFATYSDLNPPCTEGNPSANIRAALAMLYFALFLMALTLQVSIKSYKLEQSALLGGEPSAVSSSDSSSHSSTAVTEARAPRRQQQHSRTEKTSTRSTAANTGLMKSVDQGDYDEVTV